MRFVLFIFAIAACGGTSDGDDSSLPDGPPGGDPFVDRTGLVEVAEQIGNWAGDPIPVSELRIRITDGDRWPFHRETARRGECRLLEFVPASCPINCDFACTVDGCIPFPLHLDAGTLSITGTLAPVTAEREPTTGRYYPTTAPPDDFFDAGASIALDAPGGADVAAIHAVVQAPPPLVTDLVSPLALADNDTAIAWTPAAGGDVFLTIASANRGHGAPYDAVIECASSDDGEITVPGNFIAALGDLSGFPCLVGHECPPAVLSRYAAAIASDVEFRVAAERVFYVMH
jgi:hypothetical protein